MENENDKALEIEYSLVREEKDPNVESFGRLIKYIVTSLVLAGLLIGSVVLSTMYNLTPRKEVMFSAKMLVVPLCLLLVIGIILLGISRKDARLKKAIPWTMIGIIAFYTSAFSVYF